MIREPVETTRQRRLREMTETRHGDRKQTLRQKSAIDRSAAAVSLFEKNAQRIANKRGISYDSAAAILAAAERRATPGRRARKS